MDLRTVVLVDSQGKYFEQHLEEHNILTLFHSGDRIKDLHKYSDIIGFFKIFIIKIGSNDTCKDDTSTMLHRKVELIVNMSSFIVQSSNEKTCSVQLFLKEWCNCPLTTSCWHIITCKLTIGITDFLPKNVSSTFLNWNKIAGPDLKRNLV